MQEPGTIQPARFLTGTGQIRPGVQRVVSVKKPAVGIDWTQQVPGGVMWRVNTIQATLAINISSAVESVEVQYTVNGLNVGKFQSPTTPTAGATVTLAAAIGQNLPSAFPDPNILAIWMPDILLPAGSKIASTCPSLGITDQWSNINMFIDEYYFTDEQLTDIEIQKYAAERLYVQQLEQAYEQQTGGVQ